ncbi:MAG TPA: ABC transporter substrate-binding protein [Candidatus Acidoferrales bacterium]|nr:ABC transporter substrate-binding protein [Candidatus Acidoferrales bacterium]
MQRTKHHVACASIVALIYGAFSSANAWAQDSSAAAQKIGTERLTGMPAAKRTVIDESGRKVEVPARVRRIVTLAPNLAEIVYALGAQDRLVGVSNFTDYPAEAKSKPSIGMPVNPSLEAIVGARPDLVLATAVNTWETVNSLARLGIAVYTTDPHTVAGMLRSITDIGDVIGASEQAQALVQKLQARLDSLKAKLANASPVPALFVVWDHPLQSVGENTFIADALRWAGARSVIRTKQNWPLVSMEEIVKLNPEYIIYAENHMGADSGSDSAKLANVPAAIARHLNQLRADETWRQLPAVRAGHIAVVSDEIDVPAPGLVDVIEQLAQELHPEIFQKQNQSSFDNFLQHRRNAPGFPNARQSFSPEAASCAR